MNSVWTMDCDIPRRESLKNGGKAEVAVIGAGMAGILTAFMLKREGVDAAVIEADAIASGQTCGTTAKITSQHGAVYKKLIDTFGRDKAKLYAEANQKAVYDYRRLISENAIDCGFEEADAFLFGEKETVADEYAAALSLGLPAEIIYREKSARLKFSGQAQFHPLKFIKAISEDLTVYENTRVTDVEDDNTLVTDKGVFYADKIVFACHFPFINLPGMYFARMHQTRSYVLALTNADAPDGMWIGTGDKIYSFRHYGDILLFGGESHRTGEKTEKSRYEALREKAREFFPKASEIAHWSAQDCITPDSVPYIGNYAESKPDWYVATGFNKWGMTSSMAAAEIITDMIIGRENPYSEVFDPSRFELKTAAGAAVEAGNAVKGLAKRFLDIPDTAASELEKGDGGIVLYGGEKVGIYKDENGLLHPVDPVCTHMGCELAWNADEKSWDCPCHGSRFDFEGNVIASPAFKNIT